MKENYSYDIKNPDDKIMALDLPFNQLNKRGRKAKKKIILSGDL